MTEPYAVPVPKGYRVGGWEVREPLATGAFGSVYAGRRTHTDEGEGEGIPRTAALKFLPTGTGTPRQLTHLRELVEHEVELHRRLKRPRLIRMYETLVVDDPGRPELAWPGRTPSASARGSCCGGWRRRRARAARPGCGAAGPDVRRSSRWSWSPPRSVTA